MALEAGGFAGTRLRLSPRQVTAVCSRREDAPREEARMTSVDDKAPNDFDETLPGPFDIPSRGSRRIADGHRRRGGVSDACQITAAFD